MALNVFGSAAIIASYIHRPVTLGPFRITDQSIPGPSLIVMVVAFVALPGSLQLALLGVVAGWPRPGLQGDRIIAAIECVLVAIWYVRAFRIFRSERSRNRS